MAPARAGFSFTDAQAWTARVAPSRVCASTISELAVAQHLVVAPVVSLGRLGIKDLLFAVDENVSRRHPLEAADSALSYAFLAFSALTAGLFEETGRWLGYRFLIKKERSWRVGVMYGLGHGGIESILLIGINMAVLLVLYVALARGIQLPLPKDKLDVIVRVVSGLTPGQTLAGGIERLFRLVSASCERGRVWRVPGALHSQTQLPYRGEDTPPRSALRPRRIHACWILQIAS